MRIYKTVSKVPGGLMVVPLFIGMVINRFFPALLKIGGLTAWASHWGQTINLSAMVTAGIPGVVLGVFMGSPADLFKIAR